jgi:glycosyltransferase involved in cell wall biosynthesis
VAYSDAEIEPLTRGPVLLAGGRFTAVKRLGLLVRAFAAAQRRVDARPALVLLGGHPGEWEDEHPLQAIQATGTRDVFLAGWHDHAALPEFFNASDAVVMASVAEQFGLVLVEGMACGLPAVAIDRLGPSEIVAPGETGWLVPPDDVEALGAALADVVDGAAERRRRGARAREDVLERFAWPALAERLSATLEDAAQSRAGGLSAQK